MKMASNVRTFSVPHGSDADMTLNTWANEGENVSDKIREAIEAAMALDAMKRQLLALRWTVAKLGVCPSVLEPPENPPLTGHYCLDCRSMIDPCFMARPEWVGAYGMGSNRWTAAEGRVIKWAVSVTRPLDASWRRKESETND